ncbi:hypothetical protein QM467_11395 [Rhodoblastus sp. 17X3]|uniref:hypothetical protein n=1 Tax=Rhodoblastus sp. 17X3 TaxID=3047026 RepID=UPI0024B7661A|nr:hypothetical protein [Rhodoblastus sp. 17X3]MDI9848660.1 hypothetical protein [Rhodoblastus sp. 17X3]
MSVVSNPRRAVIHIDALRAQNLADSLVDGVPRTAVRAPESHGARIFDIANEQGIGSAADRATPYALRLPFTAQQLRRLASVASGRGPTFQFFDDVLGMRFHAKNITKTKNFGDIGTAFCSQSCGAYLARPVPLR